MPADRFTTAIRGRGIAVAYGNKLALPPSDVTVPAGLVAAVIGPNGSGKTTLLNAITGLAEAEDAAMLVLGRHRSRRTAWASPGNRRVLLHPPCAVPSCARSKASNARLDTQLARSRTRSALEATEEPMERILETHQFGSHRVVVLEHAGDDETTYSVLVDNTTATDSPLPNPPNLEDVVRIYTRAIEQRV